MTAEIAIPGEQTADALSHGSFKIIASDKLPKSAAVAAASAGPLANYVRDASQNRRSTVMSVEFQNWPTSIHISDASSRHQTKSDIFPTLSDTNSHFFHFCPPRRRCLRFKGLKSGFSEQSPSLPNGWQTGVIPVRLMVRFGSRESTPPTSYDSLVGRWQNVTKKHGILLIFPSQLLFWQSSFPFQ